MSHVTAVILAAGGSSRLGYPKQLLESGGQSILQKLIDDITVAVDDLLVVTGAYSDAVVGLLPGVTCVHNTDWTEGMGGSIAVAVEALASHTSHILIGLCDQVKIPASHYAELIHNSREYPDDIWASSYDGVFGVPVIFPKKYFPQLSNLKGCRGGAHAIIQEYPHKLIACEAAAFDLDEPQDVDKWRKQT
ncbi:NTP transferase domain-containing protein [Marinicella sp. W31]|uniref:nucleotidyltransferase family protein n=1 Tax=Marinicella sp. W31 TaxID=3023713 RepID=UPI0037579BB0